VTDTGQGHGAPKSARPAGRVRGYWAGQPLPRQALAVMANFISNG
jgi:hypothetical protein